MFSFEILREREYGERDLIHRLTERTSIQAGDYEYRNLVDAGYLSLARRRMVERSVTFRNLILLTAAIGAVVLVVQLLYPSSWADSVILSISTTAAIVALLFVIRRN